MYLRLLSLVFLLSCQCVFAQNHKKINELKKKLATATTDSAVVELTTILAYEVMDYDRQRAMQYFNELEAVCKKSKYRRGFLSVHLGKGAVMDYEAKFDSAFYFYSTGLKMAEEMKDLPAQSRFHLNMGLIYLRQSKHPETMEQYNIAQSLSEKTGNEGAVANILRKKANLVLQDLDYKRAKGFYRQSIDVYERLKDSGTLGETYGSLGFAYRNEGKNDSAIYYFQKANIIFKALHYSSMIAVAHTEIGKALFEQKKYALALDNYEAAEAIYDTLHYMQHQDALHIYMGDALLALHQPAKASQHYEKALQMAHDSKDQEQESEATYGLFKISQMQNDYKTAIHYLQTYDSLKDVIAKNKQLDKVTEMTEKYESEKKERTIQQQQFELTKKNYVITGSVALLLLTSLLGYSYYRRYRLRQEKKLQSEIISQQDLSTKAVLRAEENERERIAKELHDGVGQIMSAVKMNLSAIEKEISFAGQHQQKVFEKSIALVDESCREVRTVSHQMMPNALLKKGLASAIRDFVEQIDNRILNVELYSEGLNERIDTNIETVLYRVVQECVNNVIKHSGANHLDISLLKDKDSISITIEDNGKGFNIAEQMNTEGLGLKNIRTRIQYLKGTVDFDSTPGKGTLIAIHIPA